MFFRCSLFFAFALLKMFYLCRRGFLKITNNRNIPPTRSFVWFNWNAKIFARFFPFLSFRVDRIDQQVDQLARLRAVMHLAFVEVASWCRQARLSSDRLFFFFNSRLNSANDWGRFMWRRRLEDNLCSFDFKSVCQIPQIYQFECTERIHKMNVAFWLQRNKIDSLALWSIAFRSMFRPKSNQCVGKRRPTLIDYDSFSSSKMKWFGHACN